MTVLFGLGALSVWAACRLQPGRHTTSTWRHTQTPGAGSVPVCECLAS